MYLCNLLSLPGPWKLFYRQTHDTYLSVNSWLSVNPNDPSLPNYSILGTLDDAYKNSDDKFTFKLVWPNRSGGNYNMWSQSTNPVTEKSVAEPVGYDSIDLSFATNDFIGLHYSSSSYSGTVSSLLDGSRGGK